MSATLLRRTLCLVLPALLCVALAPAAAEKKEEKKPDNPAAKPIERLGDKGWKARHEKFVDLAKKGDIDVVFLGDSITHGWEGQPAWKKTFEPLKAANFGIGGDQTGHVLWRITEGKELEGIKPKVFVIMIGTNNTGGHTPEQIAGGVQAIVEELRKSQPQAKILLLGIFPRAAKPDDPARLKVAETNKLLTKLDDGKNVKYLDIGDKFLESDHTISKDIMPDFLHLSQKGYDIWAAAIAPTVEKMLK